MSRGAQTAASGGPRSDLAARLDLQSRTRRRTRVRRLALAVVSLAVMVTLIWLVWFSAVLETREVVVRGTELTSPGQVIEVAQVPLGMPLARIPRNAISQRVLALPAVAEVKLHRQWPNQLAIEVVERELVFQRIDDDRFQWVDASGRIFHLLPERSPGVVAVTAREDPRMLADVATVVAALPADVAASTHQVEASTIDHIVILLTDGRTIVWGNAERSAEKAALLPTLLAMGGSIFDVSVPSHPAVR